MADTMSYYVHKRSSTWDDTTPGGSSSKISDEIDASDNYWEFEMVKDDVKHSFVLSKDDLRAKTSFPRMVGASIAATTTQVSKNYEDPDAAGTFNLRYVPETFDPRRPEKWVLTDTSRDGFKLVVKEATATSWIEHKPVFSVILVGTLIGIFSYYAKDDCEDPMSDCPTFSNFALAYRMCCREQLWRWFTYSLMHSSVAHIVGNLVMLILLAAPLEMVHGSWRIIALYFIGAIAGSLGSSMFDPTANVVGASGACYMYLGAWCADMAANWDSKDSVWACCNAMGKSAGKYAQIIVVSLWVLLDLGNQVHSRYTSESNVSFAGHFAGFGAGVTFGTFILKNASKQPTEIYVSWGGISVYFCAMILAVVWNVYYTYDPYRACDVDEYAKCNLTKNYAI